MKEESYRTIKKPSQGLFRDRGSKFLSFAYPVCNEDEIGELIASLRKKYNDASHHCFAWMTGPENNNFRTNDDGEPSNTAGKPILGQIIKFDVTNILIIVVRYFGGTLLGTGGLINAYREAAADALRNSEIITRTIYACFKINFSYMSMNHVMKVLKEEQAVQVKQDFGTDCSIIVHIETGKAEKLVQRLKMTENISVENWPGSFQ